MLDPGSCIQYTLSENFGEIELFLLYILSTNEKGLIIAIITQDVWSQKFF